MMIEAVVSAVATLLVCILNNNYQMKLVREQNSEHSTLIEYKIDELAKRQDKHNGVIERTYEVEKQIVRHCEQIADNTRRINTLEEMVRNE